MPSEESETLARTVRRHTTGALLAGDVTTEARFVIDGDNGELLLPLSRADLEHDAVTLFVPDESPDSVQILARPREVEERTTPACDRWIAYHLRPTASRWGALRIESVKRRSDVLDADEIDLRNALREIEPKLCTMLNARREDVASLCEHTLGVRPVETTVVGVDQDGLDVRGRFGVLRVETDSPLSLETARDTLEQMLRAGGP